MVGFDMLKYWNVVSPNKTGGEYAGVSLSSPWRLECNSSLTHLTMTGLLVEIDIWFYIYIHIYMKYIMQLVIVWFLEKLLDMLDTWMLFVLLSQHGLLG
jgi:hypothetical protein